MDLQDFLQQGEGREEDKIVAWNLFQQAYEAQMKGRLEEAVQFYKQSLESFPTAEAYTFLGWTYSFMGQLSEAIDECQRAITLILILGTPTMTSGPISLNSTSSMKPFPGLKKLWKLNAMRVHPSPI